MDRLLPWWINEKGGIAAWVCMTIGNAITLAAYTAAIVGAALLVLSAR